MTTLHVYEVEQWDGEIHLFAAESLEAATEVAQNWGDVRMGDDFEIRECPDEMLLPLTDCNDPSRPTETKTCAEWLVGLSAGDLLASTVVS